MKRYIMACDERGTSRWPSSSNTWAMGGFIIEMNDSHALTKAWENIKLKLCGDKDVELKWSHFFPGHHQQSSSNPLLSNDPQEWREQAIWAISELFKQSKLLPVNIVVRKDKASESAFITTEDGRQVLDTNTLWVGVIGQFALFLKQSQAKGEMWFDQLGSRQEETRKQADWLRLRDVEWSVNPENQVLLKRIAPTMQFYDSHEEPLVQVADFVSGVIWAASEDDDEFLLNALNDYFPTGPSVYTLIHFK